MNENEMRTPTNGPFGALTARLQAAAVVQAAEEAAKDAAEKAVAPAKADWKRSITPVPAAV